MVRISSLSNYPNSKTKTYNIIIKNCVLLVNDVLLYILTKID